MAEKWRPRERRAQGELRTSLLPKPRRYCGVKLVLHPAEPTVTSTYTVKPGAAWLIRNGTVASPEASVPLVFVVFVVL